MSFEGLYEEVVGTSSLQDAGSCDGQEACGEQLSGFGLISEADLSPLDAGTQHPFGGVVCGLDSFDLQEGEQAVPVLEQALGRFSDIVIRALHVLLEALVHPGSDGDRLADKRLPVQMSLFERMPESEHSACLRKHPLGEFHGVRASAGVLDAPDAPDDVRPTKLADALVERLVCGIHV